MRFIDIPVEVDFMAVASYGSATDSSGVVRILKDLDVAIEGRDVLIVEDIVDSGLTLQYLLRNLGSRNPASLEVCALLTKPDRRKVDLPDPLCGLRDTRPLRDRLRPRLRRAPSQPAVRGGAGAVTTGVRTVIPSPTSTHVARRQWPQTAGDFAFSWYAGALAATTPTGASTPRIKP